MSDSTHWSTGAVRGQTLGQLDWLTAGTVALGSSIGYRSTETTREQTLGQWGHPKTESEAVCQQVLGH